MKTIIFKHDVQNLIGKFIIQITESKEEISPMKLDNDNWGFYKEKRISFVCRNSDGGIDLQGFFYKHRSFKTDEEFVEYFNMPHNSVDTRFHRLLKKSEIEFMCNKMKEEY